MTTLNLIQKFLEPKKVAIAGASRNPKKFGGVVVKELVQKGFTVYPVNPDAGEIQGLKCYKTVPDLPAEVEHLFVVTPKAQTAGVVHDAVRRKMKMIWIQQKSETPEALKMVEEAGIPLIHKKCILMFADPVKGPHAFHRFLAKMFGGYPKLVTEAN